MSYTTDQNLKSRGRTSVEKKRGGSNQRKREPRMKRISVASYLAMEKLCFVCFLPHEAENEPLKKDGGKVPIETV